MNLANTIREGFTLLLLLVVIGPLFGQRNCLQDCRMTFQLSENKDITITYRLLLASTEGKIIYDNGKYLVDFPKAKDVIKAKLIFSDLPKDLTLFVSGGIKASGDFMQFPDNCTKLGVEVLNFQLTVNFYREASEFSNEVKFGVSETGSSSCASVSHHYSLLPFEFSVLPSSTSPKVEKDSLANNGNQDQAVNSSSTNINSVEEETAPGESITTTSQNKEDSLMGVNNPPRPRIVPPPLPQPENKTLSTEEKLEQTAWKKTVRLGTLEAYYDFKENSLRTRYRRALNKAIALRERISPGPPMETEDGYKVAVKNVFTPGIDTILDADSTVQTFFIEGDDRFTDTLYVRNVDHDKNIELMLVDPAKPDSVNRITIFLGDHLELKVGYTEDSTGIRFEFERGDPPYRVDFFMNGRYQWTEPLDSNATSWTASLDSLKKRGLIGEVLIKYSDDRQRVPFYYGTISIIEEERNQWYWLGGIAVFLLLSVVIYPMVKQFIRRRRRDRYLSERSSKWQSHMAKMNEQKRSLQAEIKEEIEEGGNAFEGEKDTSEEEKPKTGIKILKVKKATSKSPKQYDEQLLNEILKSELCFGFDTTLHWENTSVNGIFFTGKTIEKLDQFLRAENLVPLQEQGDQIPEIGGILLGRPFHSPDTGKFRVLVEEFVPIDPEYNDKYQLEFSAKSLAKDLGAIQDEFSDLLLVGWFHTHPGHGLFLSRPDLRIHDSFFKENYQFAMEIDSLTNRLDTGFFTRMEDGSVNNRKNLLPHSQWHSWLEVESHM